MEFALGTTTLLALAMTVTMGVVTWRLVREERRRSAARLAALAAELRRRQEAPIGPPSAEGLTKARLTLPSTAAAAPVDVAIPGPEAARSVPDQYTSAGTLFDTPTGDGGGWSRQLAGLGAAGVVLVAIAAAVLGSSAGNRGEEFSFTNRVPVELLALDHERQDGWLAISGAVRNPLEGRVATHVIVLATAFDRGGATVASQRVPLELETLPPGGESPFAISLPAERASRYRISFLIDETTVPHIDRRIAPAPGAVAPPTKS